MRRITTADQDFLLAVSPCDEDEVDTFTSGDCWKLAKELHLRGVGRLIAVAERDDHTMWCHMAVELSDGRVLDANGLQTREAFLQRWGVFLLGTAEAVFYDPTDEAHWHELTYDQLQDFSEPEDVAAVADKLIGWLEEL